MYPMYRRLEQRKDATTNDDIPPHSDATHKKWQFSPQPVLPVDKPSSNSRTSTTIMASIAEQQPEYVPEKPVFENDRLHFVCRVADGDRYLAQKYDLSYFPELLHLREEKPDDKIISFEAAARVLNHENLISIVKPMTIPTDSASSRHRNKDFFLLHEFCADGNLARLFDKPPVEVVTDYGFLPEGLVWHVALSMLRALTFLHEGWREKIVLSKEDDTVVRRWYRPDDDWMPILHRSIRPENIHFQARRGKESYGLCKLGDFSRCIVAGTTRVPDYDNLEVLAVLNNPDENEDEASQEQIRELWHVAHERVSIHSVKGPDWSDTLTVSDTSLSYVISLLLLTIHNL